MQTSLFRRTAVIFLSAFVSLTPFALSQQFTVLHAFNGTSDGGGLHAGLVFDKAGNLYGTAHDGGAPTYGYGTAFLLTPKSDGKWADMVIHDFRVNINYSHPDGLNPQSGLVADATGNLYGTTYYGGEPYDKGTVFELSRDDNGHAVETILHEFNGNDGGYPAARMIFDSAGNLYGTTYGTPYHCGTVFKLSLAANGNWTHTVLYNFPPSGTDGCGISAGVVFDSSGNLYGTASSGGANSRFKREGEIPPPNDGLIFKLTRQSTGVWKETVLHRFSPSEGITPWGGVILDKAGNVYGTTLGGGSQACVEVGCGTIFKLTSNANGTWSETILRAFNGDDGSNPEASMIFDSEGNLYGTTSYGGNSACNMGCGVVFKLVPDAHGNWSETILHEFDGYDGWGPSSDLTFDGHGHLFGTTVTGGNESYCCGVAFEIKP